MKKVLAFLLSAAMLLALAACGGNQALLVGSRHQEE